METHHTCAGIACHRFDALAQVQPDVPGTPPRGTFSLVGLQAVWPDLAQEAIERIGASSFCEREQQDVLTVLQAGS